MKRVAVLVSGGGTNLQALIDAERAGSMPHATLSLVISSNADAYALTRAANAGIATEIISKRDFESLYDFEQALLKCLSQAQIDVIVLAGYLTILSPRIIQAYPNRITNVHPSLIPAFCGEGYYGLRVHEAVLERGCKLSGATVHLVNEVVDGGRILLQKAVEVKADDTADSLQRRIMEEAEWLLLPQAVELLCGGML